MNIQSLGRPPKFNDISDFAAFKQQNIRFGELNSTPEIVKQLDMANNIREPASKLGVHRLPIFREEGDKNPMPIAIQPEPIQLKQYSSRLGGRYIDNL